MPSLMSCSWLCDVCVCVCQDARRAASKSGNALQFEALERDAAHSAKVTIAWKEMAAIEHNGRLEQEAFQTQVRESAVWQPSV